MAQKSFAQRHPLIAWTFICGFTFFGALPLVFMTLSGDIQKFGQMTHNRAQVIRTHINSWLEPGGPAARNEEAR